MPGSQLYWNQEGGLKHWVKITGATVVEGEFFYTAQKANSEFQPVRSKGTSAAGRTIIRPEEQRIKRFIRPEALEAPSRPTYRIGLFDTVANRYQEDGRQALVDGLPQPTRRTSLRTPE